MAKKKRDRLIEDGKFHELYQGNYYATSPRWIAGLDDKEVQLALYLEIVDMIDATGEEEEFGEYPFNAEISIVVAYPGPSWLEKAEQSTQPAKNAEGALEASHGYGGGVPITHDLLSIKGGGSDISKFTAEQMTWKKEKVEHGTVAAQQGPGSVFKYPMFATEEDALEFSNEILKRATAVFGMIGFFLDRPINMAGNDGWSVIKEQSE